MSYTPPTKALNAALEAVRALDGPASIGSPDVVSAALTAAYPSMEAQAKAEALREAADALDGIYVKGWLRARAATIERGN